MSADETFRKLLRCFQTCFMWAISLQCISSLFWYVNKKLRNTVLVVIKTRLGDILRLYMILFCVFALILLVI